MLPRLAMYRLSGGRIAGSGELYRATLPWQRRLLGDLPGMTSLTERAYFSWLAREDFTGKGEIVDLGAWFGSTTASLASGLERNRIRSAQRRNVHAYDRFIWEGWMDDYASLAALGRYRPGASFIPEFERVVAPWRRRIEVHAGDLLEQAWGGDGVEVLLVDAMKSWSLAGHIATAFFPAVLSAGLIIHQDFANAYTPWIHLSTYMLRDRLVPVTDVADSETLVFRLRGAPVDQETARTIAGRSCFDSATIQRAFAHSLSIAAPAKHAGIRASVVMLHIYDGDLERARSELDRFERRAEIDPGRVRAMRAELEWASSSKPSAAAAVREDDTLPHLLDR